MTTKDLFSWSALGLAAVALSVAFSERANVKTMEIRLKDLEAKHALLISPKTLAEQKNLDNLEMNPRLCLSLYGTPQKRGNIYYCDLNIEGMVGARINTAFDALMKQMRIIEDDLKVTRVEFSALNSTVLGLRKQIAQGTPSSGGESQTRASSREGPKPPVSALGGGAQLTLPDGKTSCGQAWGSGRCVDGSLVCDKGIKIYFRPGTSPSGNPKAHFICDTPG